MIPPAPATAMRKTIVRSRIRARRSVFPDKSGLRPEGRRKEWFTWCESHIEGEARCYTTILQVDCKRWRSLWQRSQILPLCGWALIAINFSNCNTQPHKDFSLGRRCQSVTLSVLRKINVRSSIEYLSSQRATVSQSNFLA